MQFRPPLESGGAFPPPSEDTTNQIVPYIGTTRVPGTFDIVHGSQEGHVGRMSSWLGLVSVCSTRTIP